jgi:hypothetical protein
MTFISFILRAPQLGFAFGGRSTEPSDSGVEQRWLNVQCGRNVVLNVVLGGQSPTTRPQSEGHMKLHNEMKQQ